MESCIPRKFGCKVWSAYFFRRCHHVCYGTQRLRDTKDENSVVSTYFINALKELNTRRNDQYYSQRKFEIRLIDKRHMVNLDLDRYPNSVQAIIGA